MLFLVLAVGCGKGKKGQLSGEITTSEGRKVTAGTITFHTESGSIPRPIGADGTYSVNQLPLGEVEVTVETESANPNVKRQTGADYAKKSGKVLKPGSQGMSSPMPETGGTAEKGEYVPIHPKYRDKKTSPLKFTVSGGKQTENFTVDPAPARKKK
jgi:hypothetical protein